MRISDRVEARNVCLGLEGRTTEDVLGEMVERLAAAGALGGATAREVLGKLLLRERQGSTGFGGGVALPHVKLEGIPATTIAIGRSEDGVDFSANDGERVHTIFLILSPPAEAEAHLDTLKWVVRLAQDRYYAKVLRGSKTVEQIVDLFAEFDDEGSS
jgi:mannitol/fructose-specific phosphotransferase system IIA component (Ntr-type)